MKAILQNFRTGVMAIEDVPPPALRPGGVLVRNATSLVSAGTEKAVIELAKMNPLQKARARPDLVKKVLARAGQEGLLGTVQVVFNLVSNPLPLGYSCAGVVDAAGAGVPEFTPGDRVACAGLGYANHAEVVYAPRNLAVRIPDPVSFEEAAFVTVGAIALHGVRQADLAVGETVIVMGLGLVGQLTAQIAASAGCRVFGLDLDQKKIDLACELGMHDGLSSESPELLRAVKRFTRERGADKILITAATSSSRLIELAAELGRDRACVVAVGDVGLNVPRRIYYEKEIDLRLSRSYGPGRYDPAYEEHGQDYPLGYVRWTENRNMEAFLDLVAGGSVRCAPLITHRYAFDNALDAYDLLSGKVSEPYVGVVLNYDREKKQSSKVELRAAAETASPQAGGEIHVGVIGAGQFAQGILLPHLKKLSGISIEAVATGQGLTARNAARKLRSSWCTSDYKDILSDEAIHAVVIATRHNLHAPMVIDSLEAGKHTFVEKPLALGRNELPDVLRAAESARGILLVGYNRRFSPMAVIVRDALAGNPLVINYRVNAGYIPPENWVHDPEVGGGRIVGEVCHFIDLMQFWTGADPVEIFASAAGRGSGAAEADNLAAQIVFSDGSVGSLNYASQGHASHPKEEATIFGAGSVAVIRNWRELDLRTPRGRSRRKARLVAEKGHGEEMAAFVRAIRTGAAPISLSSLALTSEATFALQDSLREGRAVRITAPAVADSASQDVVPEA